MPPEHRDRILVVLRGANTRYVMLAMAEQLIPFMQVNMGGPGHGSKRAIQRWFASPNSDLLYAMIRFVDLNQIRQLAKEYKVRVDAESTSQLHEMWRATVSPRYKVPYLKLRPDKPSSNAPGAGKTFTFRMADGTRLDPNARLVVGSDAGATVWAQPIPAHRRRIALRIQGRAKIHLLLSRLRELRVPLVWLNASPSSLAGSWRALQEWTEHSGEWDMMIAMVRRSDYDTVVRECKLLDLTCFDEDLPDLWKELVRFQLHNGQPPMGVLARRTLPSRKLKPKPVITRNPDGTWRYQRAR